MRDQESSPSSTGRLQPGHPLRITGSNADDDDGGGTPPSALERELGWLDPLLIVLLGLYRRFPLVACSISDTPKEVFILPHID